MLATTFHLGKAAAVQRRFWDCADRMRPRRRFRSRDAPTNHRGLRFVRKRRGASLSTAVQDALLHSIALCLAMTLRAQTGAPAASRSRGSESPVNESEFQAHLRGRRRRGGGGRLRCLI